MENSPHPSRFMLERYVARDLPPEAIEQHQTHVGSCSHCADIVRALEKDIQAFQAEVPYAAFRIKHEERRATRARQRRPLFWRAPIFAALAGAAAVLFLVNVRGPSDTPTIRLKGDGVGLSFAVRDADGHFRPGVSGESLSQGSAVQLAYDAGDNAFMALLGIDERGVVTLYFPEGGERLERVPAGAQGTLPFSLTPGAGVERFVAVFAPEPVALAPILTAARGQAPDGAAMALPSGIKQSSIWVRGP